ncbi:MAG TPA: S-layer homology domain-containing protein [Vicinamibacteria bacterium]|nr:S-layer homology domain-containing protein [Vicinamibacteria bacterium]
MIRNVALASVLLATTSALAQVPAGGEFQVNSYTTGVRGYGWVSMAANGDFVVTWGDVWDGSYFGVAARRYDARGNVLGTEFLVNTTTEDYQLQPVVASDARGNFAVMWMNWSLDGTGWNMFGQRFDAQGGRRGGEFAMNTTLAGSQFHDTLAMNAEGQFVAAWSSPGQDGSSYGVYAQRYDAGGNAAGAEFRVNTHTTDNQRNPRVAINASGEFVIAWTSRFQDGDSDGIFGQRFRADGTPMGAEFRVNDDILGRQYRPFVGMADDGGFVVAWNSNNGSPQQIEVRARAFDAAGNGGSEFAVNTSTAGDQYVRGVAADALGNFVVTWQDSAADGSGDAVLARRFRAGGAPRGGPFQVNAYTTGDQDIGRVASDRVGNFIVTWDSDRDGSSVYAQRLGGLVPSALEVDTAGNHVLEPGESVDLRPSWRNVNGASQTFAAQLSNMSGPPGPAYTIVDGGGDYGTVADGATGACADCYEVAVSSPAARPATHWDASVVESITPDAQGQQKVWRLHVGRSFTDVPASSGFYTFVERLVHAGVTGGCASESYCPGADTSREQMAVFVLVAKEGARYRPPACGTPVFADVPPASPFCRWIEELARRGVVSGCGGGNYCPADPVRREQMAVFVLRTLDPALDPPACTTPLFGDVPASSPFCRWIEELARRGVVTGCGGGNYCPGAPVTREQMGVFISVTFGLTLYGP